MEERIGRLEAQVRELTSAVHRLEAELHATRSAAQERAPALAETRLLRDADLPIVPPALAPEITHARIFALLGRSFLALGGAFLIRALTDANTLPAAAGLLLAFGLALALGFLADRAYARKAPVSAAFHAATGGLIAYPLIWESASRLHLLPDSAAAVALAIYTLVLLAVARRHTSPALAWLSMSAGLATALGLLIFTDGLAPLAAALLILLGAAMWLADERRWSAFAWPIALVLAVVLMRLGNSFSSAVDAEVGPAASISLALAYALLLACGVALRRLVWKRAPNPFEWAMVPLGLAVSLHVLTQTSGTNLAGGLALALAAVSYAAAFSAYRRDPLGTAAIQLHGLLGVGLAIAGSELLIGGAAPGAVFSVLGLCAAILARRNPSDALSMQAVVWLWAGALRSGLLAFAGASFFGDGSSPFARLALVGCAALACSVGAAALARARERESWLLRSERVATLALAFFAVASLAAAAGTRALGAGDPGALATLRTAVLALSAVTLTVLGRALPMREWIWLGYAALGLGGLKLAVQDLPHGRALTLVLAFGFYGLALIFTPRLARAASPTREA